MKKILLIEDNLDVRENTAEILELANYTVCTAPDGKDGVEMARKEKPDLIICDIMMPVLDGYGVLHMLNKNEELRNIPFIFLTAKTERLDFRKGMEMGADDYITKPFTELELLNAIEQRLKKVDVYKKKYTKADEGMRNLLEDIGKQDVWKDFASDRNINHYKRKSLIYSEGNHPNRLFYVKKGMLIQKNYGEFIPNIHKILHILSVGTMLVFCTIDLFGSGRILMSQITIVFIVCVPIEIYIIVSNRNRIMSHLNHQNYKNISLFFVATILITCITTMVLLLGIDSPTILLISLTFFFTTPIFFTVLLGRELFI